MLLSQAPLKPLDLEKILRAKLLYTSDLRKLEALETLSVEQELSLHRRYICDFYSIAPTELSLELLQWDTQGLRRAMIIEIEALFNYFPPITPVIQNIECFLPSNIWNVAQIRDRQKLRTKLQLRSFLWANQQWEIDRYKTSADLARELQTDIQSLLHCTWSKTASDMDIVHQLLAQLSLDVTHIDHYKPRQTSLTRFYQINPTTRKKIRSIIHRRARRRTYSQNLKQ